MKKFRYSHLLVEKKKKKKNLKNPSHQKVKKKGSLGEILPVSETDYFGICYQAYHNLIIIIMIIVNGPMSTSRSLIQGPSLFILETEKLVALVCFVCWKIGSVGPWDKFGHKYLTKNLWMDKMLGPVSYNALSNKIQILYWYQ